MALYELGGMSTHWKVIASVCPSILPQLLTIKNLVYLLRNWRRGEFWKGMGLIVTFLCSFWAVSRLLVQSEFEDQSCEKSQQEKKHICSGKEREKLLPRCSIPLLVNTANKGLCRYTVKLFSSPF